MRMAHIVTKMNAFSADITFCHIFFLLCNEQHEYFNKRFYALQEKIRKKHKISSVKVYFLTGLL